MIILNEKKYAEECILSGHIDKKPFFTLTILAKYYSQCCGYSTSKISMELTNFMRTNYPRYFASKSSWDECIEKIASNANKYPIYEIDEVCITESELSIIDKLDSTRMQRVLFTLLCLAKLGNSKNPQNNGWVNNDLKEIFSLSRVTCNASIRDEIIGDLGILGLIEFPKKNGNLSNRVTFIDNDSKDVLHISDFRELGYEYLRYKGENIIQCQQCNILIRGNKAGTKKYCSTCAAYTPQETKYITCIDCGKQVEIDSKNNKTHRCKICQSAFIRAYDRERKRKKSQNSV